MEIARNDLALMEKSVAWRLGRFSLSPGLEERCIELKVLKLLLNSRRHCYKVLCLQDVYPITTAFSLNTITKIRLFKYKKNNYLQNLEIFR